MSDSKNPYEIRLELLQMAKEHLEGMFKAQTDFVTQVMAAQERAYFNNVAICKDAMPALPAFPSADELKKLMPAGYSIADITDKAAELYRFVTLGKK
jgi:hypothetical protein